MEKKRIVELKIKHLVAMNEGNRLIPFLMEKQGEKFQGDEYFLDTLFKELLPFTNNLNSEQREVMDMLGKARETKQWRNYYHL